MIASVALVCRLTIQDVDTCSQDCQQMLMLCCAVSVRLIANFKKMKALSKDVKLIVAALETSQELVVSGHRVRRKDPLPVIDFTAVALRTAIVDNLPDKATIGTRMLQC